MSEKKRILFFIDWYYPAYKAGGPISSVRNLCLQLKKDFDLLVVTSDRDLGDTQPLSDITPNEITSVEGVNVIYLSPDQITVVRFKKIADEFNPDIIHLNSLFSAMFTLLPLKTFKGQGKKIVISPRGMFGKESLKIKPLKKKLFFVFAKATSLFKNVIWHATSSLEANEIKSKIGDHITIGIANNVPFLPENISSIPNKTTGELNLLSVGRLAPIKNFDFLLEALAIVKSKVILKIVGPEEEENYSKKCRTLAEQLPANVHVDFLGGMSPVAINSLYSETHVFISASKNENFGHSIAEALGFGRPVIVSDKTPWKDLEKDGIGFDLPLEKEKFAEKIEYFASLGQQDFDVYCKKAREKALQVADPAKSISSYRSLYEL